MSSTVQNLEGNLLLCDDLSDTGITLNRSIEWLKKYPPLQGKINLSKQQFYGKKQNQLLIQILCSET
jgi:hypoxanthine phosphoribosyltransferase